MIEFICLFFPTFISLSVLERIEKPKENIKRLNNYAIYNILINLIGLLTVSYLNGFEVKMVDSLYTILFSIKYLLLTSIIAFILPYAINYIKNNFKIKFKREKSK